MTTRAPAVLTIVYLTFCKNYQGLINFNIFIGEQHLFLLIYFCWGNFHLISFLCDFDLVANVTLTNDNTDLTAETRDDK